MKDSGVMSAKHVVTANMPTSHSVK